MSNESSLVLQANDISIVFGGLLPRFRRSFLYYRSCLKRRRHGKNLTLITNLP